MIKPGEIQKIANRLGLRDTQIEKDYVISWVLNAIADNKFLKTHLVFKGGTALRKIYFPAYRLSEDLDFTYKGNDFNFQEIKKSFSELIDWLKKEARITLNIQDESEYKTGNYNFYLEYSGPLGGAGGNKNIKVDISCDETICNKPEEKNVMNEYSDLKAPFSILSYSLGEIISEKMRSLMQRTIPRDLYDIWYLFAVENKNIEDYIFDFQKKAKYKNLNPDDLTKTVILKVEIFKRQWNISLVNQIKTIPAFEDVWRTLGKHWKKFDKLVKS